MNAESIFAAAIEFSGERRSAFLDSACGADEALRQRVEALLLAQDAIEGLLAPADQLAETEPGSGASPGMLIAGRYKLLEVIGEGGMGSVWLAEQREPVRRKVAVKLIKPGMDTAQVLARFESERQALALMDHPHIAKIFDGGTTEAGRPFFVMEYVKGTPLTEYCDHAKLGLQERLRLFVSVCQAVQHAHQKGVIHRDLKPSNILVALVDGRPEPKVIDFGLAKAMHQSLTEKTLHTAMGMMVGTPLYISPEQAEPNNLDIDTRTDIYSLGVILYELLTGTTPLERQQLKAAAFQEVLRLIKEVEPPKPSTRLSHSDSLPSIAAQRGVDPQQLRKSLTGDLDWIAMKALDKDRNRRYETANGLARDIERFLNDEAVEASPPSAAYRLKKLVRRYRVSLAVAATFAVVLLIAASVSTWQAIRATNALEAEAQQRKLAQRHEREANQQRVKAEASAKREAAERARAEKARDRAREAIDSMTSFEAYQSLATQVRLSEEQKRFLTQALPFYEEFAVEEARDRKSLERAADAARRVAVIEGRLGRLEKSRTAFAKEVEARRLLSEQYPDSEEYADFYSQACLALGNILGMLEAPEEALVAYGEARLSDEKLAKRLPKDPKIQYRIACDRGSAVAPLKNMGRLAEALEESERVLRMEEDLVARFPEAIEYEIALAQSGNLHAELLDMLGRRDEALSLFLATRDRWLRLKERAPQEPAIQFGLRNSHGYLGAEWLDRNAFDEAEQSFLAERELLEKEHERFLGDAYIRVDLAKNHGRLGMTYIRLKRLDKANDEFADGGRLSRELCEEFPAVPGYRQLLGMHHQNLGILRRQEGGIEQAATEFDEARKIQERLVADYPATLDFRFDLFQSLRLLGEMQSSLDLRAEARGAFEKARDVGLSLAEKRPNWPDCQSQLATVHDELGMLFAAEGEWDAAQRENAAARKLLSLLVERFPSGEYRTQLGGANCNFGQILLKQGLLEPSLDHIDTAIDLLTLALRSNAKSENAKTYLFNSHHARAVVSTLLRRFAEANEDWEMTAELAPDVLVAWQNLQAGFPLLQPNDIENAIAALDRGMARRPPTAIGDEEMSREQAALYCLYLMERAQFYLESKSDERAIEWWGKELRALEDFNRRWPLPEVAERLRSLHENRAVARERLHQYGEAAEDWREVVASAQPNQLAWANFRFGAALLRAGELDKAESALDRGLALREQAAEEAGPNAREPAWLEAIYLSDRAFLYFEATDSARAIEWYAKALGHWKTFERTWPGPDVAQQLRWLHQHCAEAHDRLKQYSEAIEDWNRTLDYCPPEDVNSCRMARCFSQLRAGQSSAALAQAEELAKLTDGDGPLFYRLARFFCLLGGVDASRTPECNDRAMLLLKQAIDKGFADAAMIGNDPDLNPLRDREEFQHLLQSMTSASPANPGGASAKVP